MNVYFTIAVVGIFASGIMALFLSLVHSRKIPDADMVTAIGTIFTADIRNAKRIGIAVHLTFGMLFAFVYLGIASYLGFTNWYDFLYFGAIFGFAHGLVASILVVILVAEHHPQRRFRRAGFAVVAAQGIAHVIYGVSLGVGAATIDPNLEAMQIFGQGIL